MVKDDQQLILITDDDFSLRELTRDALELGGFAVIEAENGEQALELFESQNPDLLLLDVLMPVMDGYEATRKIRQMDTYQHVPIIALTAKAMQEDRDKCIEAGASEYLTKPIDTPKLLSMLRIWLYKASK